MIDVTVVLIGLWVGIVSGVLASLVAAAVIARWVHRAWTTVLNEIAQRVRSITDKTNINGGERKTLGTVTANVARRVGVDVPASDQPSPHQ